MPDFRSHCPTPADAANAAEITLQADESHHLVVVNRARPGAPVVAFDGHGREWLCELARDSKNAAILKVLSTRQAVPLPCRITLAQALPKGPAMDAIVRKATEIGAARIAPLESERTQVHLDPGRGDKKTDKWRTAALEAAKQCGNPWLPEILPVQNATAFMRASADAGYDLRLIASLHDGARSLKTVLADYRSAHGGGLPKNVLWLIGPEGDFSPAEMRAARDSGIVPVTLGPLVLRCETAATCALGILSYELQNT